MKTPKKDVERFEDGTGFERLILKRGFPPLAYGSGGVHTLDLRGSDLSLSTVVHAQAVGMFAFIGGKPKGLTLNDLRPLMFGSAWKVLDLLVELAMDVSGRRRDDRGFYSFAKKVKAAPSLPAVRPFESHPKEWRALMRLCIATQDLRHDLVHGKTTVGANGDLVPSTAVTGAATMTAVDQELFCHVSQRAAEGVIKGAISRRYAADLTFTLGRFPGRLVSPVTGGAEMPVYRDLVQVKAEEIDGIVVIDLDELRAQLAAWYTPPYFDFEIYLGDGSVIEGRSDDAPGPIVRIDLARIPKWLTVTAAN